MSDIFDFGFTAVDENELEAVQQAQTVANELSSGASDLEERLNGLYNAILPLLSNLKANPEKDYIYWPNRVEKVEQFEDHISKFVKD
jgi:hypothetical protein